MPIWLTNWESHAARECRGLRPGARLRAATGSCSGPFAIRAAIRPYAGGEWGFLPDTSRPRCAGSRCGPRQGRLRLAVWLPTARFRPYGAEWRCRRRSRIFFTRCARRSHYAAEAYLFPAGGKLRAGPAGSALCKTPYRRRRENILQRSPHVPYPPFLIRRTSVATVSCKPFTRDL